MNALREWLTTLRAEPQPGPRALPVVTTRHNALSLFLGQKAVGLWIGQPFFALDRELLASWWDSAEIPRPGALDPIRDEVFSTDAVFAQAEEPFMLVSHLKHLGDRLQRFVRAFGPVVLVSDEPAAMLAHFAGLSDTDAEILRVYGRTLRGDSVAEGDTVGAMMDGMYVDPASGHVCIDGCAHDHPRFHGCDRFMEAHQNG